MSLTLDKEVAMYKKILKLSSILLILLLLPFGLMGAQIKGKIQSITRKAGTIQMMNLKTKRLRSFSLINRHNTRMQSRSRNSLSMM